MQDGIYKNIPDAEYRAWPALSKSTLWSLGTSKTIKPRNALLGNIMHESILETHLARQVIENPHKRSTKAGKAFEAQQPEGVVVLSKAEMAGLRNAGEGIRAHGTLVKLRDWCRANQDRCELSLIWRDQETGVRLKCRIDVNAPTYLFDWKTTSARDAEEFGYGYYTYGYPVQSALYSDGFKHLTGEEKEFRFAVASKTEPNAWITVPDERDRASGRLMYRKMLQVYAALTDEYKK